jgi:hypothetical protein
MHKARQCPRLQPVRPSSSLVSAADYRCACCEVSSCDPKGSPRCADTSCAALQEPFAEPGTVGIGSRRGPSGQEQLAATLQLLSMSTDSQASSIISDSTDMSSPSPVAARRAAARVASTANSGAAAPAAPRMGVPKLALGRLAAPAPAISHTSSNSIGYSGAMLLPTSPHSPSSRERHSRDHNTAASAAPVPPLRMPPPHASSPTISAADSITGPEAGMAAGAVAAADPHPTPALQRLHSLANDRQGAQTPRTAQALQAAASVLQKAAEVMHRSPAKIPQTGSRSRQPLSARGPAPSPWAHLQNPGPRMSMSRMNPSPGAGAAQQQPGAYATHLPEPQAGSLAAFHSQPLPSSSPSPMEFSPAPMAISPAWQHSQQLQRASSSPSVAPFTAGYSVRPATTILATAGFQPQAAAQKQQQQPASRQHSQPLPPVMLTITDSDSDGEADWEQIQMEASATAAAIESTGPQAEPRAMAAPAAQQHHMHAGEAAARHQYASHPAAAQHAQQAQVSAPYAMSASSAGSSGWQQRSLPAPTRLFENTPSGSMGSGGQAGMPGSVTSHQQVSISFPAGAGDLSGNRDQVLAAGGQAHQGGQQGGAAAGPAGGKQDPRFADLMQRFARR